VGDAAPSYTTVRDGGFDPVPVAAQTGDSVDVRVTDAGGATLFELRVAVLARRPPIVVRTDPPRRKTDVPLNAAIVVVFSEPVAGGTLTPSSVRLFRGPIQTPVAGSVRLLEGTATAAAFVPSAPLDRNAEYRLEVTRAVRDLDGDALAAGATVEFTTGQSSTGPAASIALSPDTVFMTGATYQMTATVRDAAGNQLIDQPITWSTNDPSALTVSPTGLLTALAAGSYYVDATVNGVLGRAEVYVTAGPAASVTLSPTQATVGASGDTIKLTATVRDAAGRLLDHPSVTWTSSDVALATVAADSSGNAGLAFAIVTGVSPGSVTITATSGTASATAAVTVIPPPPVVSVTVTPTSATLVLRGTRQLSAAVRDANGKVLAGRRVDWTTDNAAVATVDANGLATGVSAGSADVTATSEGVSDTAAITVTLLSFRSVTTGWWSHSCGLTPSGAVFCWGANDVGQLGVGSTDSSTGLVAVTGGLTFSAVSAGGFHTCGITTSGAAYCWGGNEDGQLGNGSTVVSSSVPVAVSGGHTFSAVSAGRAHTCGLTTNGAAYCWGNNGAGQLGDGSTPPSRVPVAVGGLTFSSVSAGDGHTCGLTTAGAAYCWGSGLLGDGSTSSGSVPVAVSGGLTFSSVSAGFGHTCGVTTTGEAHCWGANNFGQLGDGSINGGPPIGKSRSAPVSVVGGLTFAAVSAGHEFTCGIATGGTAYCWGQDWTGTPISVPVAVTGGLTFASLSAGYFLSCGTTVDNIAYCWQVGRTPWKVAGQP